MAALVGAIFTLGTASSGFAQDLFTNQEEEDCTQIGPKEYNDRINCKTKKLTGKLDEVVTLITEDGGDLFPEKTKEHLRGARDRAERARLRTHKGKGFTRLARKQKVSQGCYIKEINTDGIGNDNDICGDEKVELKGGCEELTGDGVGDDLPPCINTGPPKDREVCLEVCEQVNNLDEEDDENFDAEAAADVEQSLDESTALLEELDTELEAKIGVVRALAGFNRLSPAELHTQNACASLVLGRLPSEIQGFALGFSNTMEAGHNVCDSVMNLDILGNNASAACSVTAIIAGVAKVVLEAMELIDDNVSGMELEAGLKCLEQTDGKIAAISTKVNGTASQVDGIVKDVADLKTTVGALQTQLSNVAALMELRFRAVETLLNTPQGRRPEFPMKEADGAQVSGQ